MAKEEEDESIIMKGLVVDWQLPSRSSLQDWLRKDLEDVNVREVVELLPNEIFKELEAIRRNFYRQTEKIIIHAYSLKLLSVEDLPKFQKSIEEAKKRFKALDFKIQAAVDSEYTKRARQYYEDEAEKAPKAIGQVSGRISVLIAPLRIDVFAWNDFLTEEMKNQMEILDKKYESRERWLRERLEGLRTEMSDYDETLNSIRKDLEEADAEVKKAYEPLSVPVDVATLKIQRQKLQDDVRSLKAEESKLSRQLERLNRNRQDENRSYSQAASWARRELDNTNEGMKFDARRLWADNLEQTAKQALEALELDNFKLTRDRLNKLRVQAKDVLARIWSVQPGSLLTGSYERLIATITLRDDWTAAKCRKSLEDLAS